MTGWEIGGLVVFCSLLTFLTGFAFGILAEREAWVIRANGHSAHHCDGKFYRIMTEDCFLREYQRRIPSDDHTCAEE